VTGYQGGDQRSGRAFGDRRRGDAVEFDVVNRVFPRSVPARRIPGRRGPNRSSSRSAGRQGSTAPARIVSEFSPVGGDHVRGGGKPGGALEFRDHLNTWGCPTRHLNQEVPDATNPGGSCLVRSSAVQGGYGCSAPTSFARSAIGVVSIVVRRSAVLSRTTLAPALSNSAREIPPLSTPTTGTAARTLAFASHPESPTNTARDADTPARRRAISTMVGAGLAVWTSSDVITVETSSLSSNCDVSTGRPWVPRWRAPPADPELRLALKGRGHRAIPEAAARCLCSTGNAIPTHAFGRSHLPPRPGTSPARIRPCRSVYAPGLHPNADLSEGPTPWVNVQRVGVEQGVVDGEQHRRGPGTYATGTRSPCRIRASARA
jgi:hypothetical protein